jgi:F-type H+-transporting ATPase subunit b
MLASADFWVAAGFLLFIMLLGYLGVHRMIANTLDARAGKIASELDEARQLREEAESLLASYKARAAEAEQQAVQIVATAREEAEALAKEAAQRMEEYVARRTQQAEAKIALAETQAAGEVRAAAADAAVMAAETILKAQTAGETGSELVARGIADVKARLH